MSHLALTLLTGLVAQTITSTEVPEAPTTVQVPAEVEVIRGGLFDAPRLPPLPSGLPPPLVLDDGSVILPAGRNLAIRAWWRAYERLPDIYQLQLDELRDAIGLAMDHGIEIGVAREKARQAKLSLQDTGTPVWLRTTLYVVAGVVAVGLGAAAGWILHGAIQH